MSDQQHSPALGRLITAPKGVREPKVDKGDTVVVIAHSKPQGGRADGEDEVVDIFVTKVRAYALAVKRAVVCGANATNEVKRDALMARAHEPEGIHSVNFKTLGKILPQVWRAELLGERRYSAPR